MHRLLIAALAVTTACSVNRTLDGAKDAAVTADAGIDAAVLDGTVDGAPMQMIFEAEDFDSETMTTHDWTLATTIGGHRGTGYMILAPDNSTPCSVMSAVTTCGASLVFDLAVPQTGTYYFFARMYASNGSHDSVWFGTDGVVRAVVDIDEDGMWHWGGGGAVSVALTAGAHTLHVWQREGARLDVVAMLPANVSPP